MHHTNSIARACFVMMGAVVLLFSLFPTSSVLANHNRCDSRLGRNYDLQTEEVKMARIEVYFDCRQLQDFRFLQSKRHDMLLGIQKWENRANRVTRSSLTTKRTIAMAELKTVHDTERGDLEANFRNQYAELAVAPATDNGTVSETAKKRKEITLALHTDRRAMRSLQKQEVSLLKNNFNQCSVAVTNEISQLMIGDTGNVNQQFLDKSAWLKREYEDLKAVPMSMSSNDYAASQSKEGPMSMPPNDYAASQSSVPPATGSMSDENPVGTIQELEGSGTVTRPSGETVEASPGMPIYQGDIVETGEDSRCIIRYADETEVTLAGGSRFEIDEYIFDPNSEGGTHQFFSWRGIFLFVSGLIPRKEVHDVDVPFAHLGIRH